MNKGQSAGKGAEHIPLLDMLHLDILRYHDGDKSVSESSRQTLLGRRYYSTLRGQSLCSAHVQRVVAFINMRSHRHVVHPGDAVMVLLSSLYTWSLDPEQVRVRPTKYKTKSGKTTHDQHPPCRMHSLARSANRAPRPGAMRCSQQRPTLLPHILAILVPRLLTTFEHSPHMLNSPPHQPSDSHSLPKLSLPLLLSSCTAIPCIDALRYACHPGNGRLGCCPSSIIPSRDPFEQHYFAFFFTANTICCQRTPLIAMSKQNVNSHRSLPDNSPSHAGSSHKEG
ncbi:hypothetical protein GGP41_004996 [Bipolaris sorokiniana]|uniref:Uncharacterized protein n=1 Tax=Cochliobolus sativus TaxID=45130 RepID=A0A8H6DV46_COCSA|nr:hypothetical protein GGP41_004996 [Bipolaris sorokiniana]